MAPEGSRALAALAMLCVLAAAPALAIVAPPKTEAELDEMADDGRVRDAIVALEAYVRAHPQHDPQRFLLARAYVENGQVEKAADQYQWIVEHSAFPNSRDKAKAELAKMDELPTMPVNDPTPPSSPQGKAKKPKEIGFPKEETGWLAETFAGIGYDTNANSGSSADRYFFFNLLQENRDSQSWYGTLGGSIEGEHAFSESLGWRGSASGDWRENPSAHFADTHDASVQTQLRWAGPQQRFAAGFVYSKSWFGDAVLDHALALVTRLETMTRVLQVNLQGEAARLRFPSEPLRDVDSFFLRGVIGPAPDPEARWIPEATVFTGFEEETHDESPFGRNVWGLNLGLTKLQGRGLSVEASAGYSKSMFDGNFTSAERRSDDHKEAGVFAHWHPGEKSRWTHSLGGRYIRNDSSEPSFDYGRFTGGYELSAVWGLKDD